MKQKLVLLWLAAVVLLAGCKASPLPETTVAETTQTTEPAETTQAAEETVPETTEETWDHTAEEVSVRASLDGQDLTGRLTDGERSTRKMLEHGGTLTIESDSPFAALYLEWDAMPHPYRIFWEGARSPAARRNSSMTMCACRKR